MGGRKSGTEWSFFMNDMGKVEYNATCQRCAGGCKQSFRVAIICCPYYTPIKKTTRGRRKADGEQNT